MKLVVGSNPFTQGRACKFRYLPQFLIMKGIFIMIYKKFKGLIPFKVGDEIEFTYRSWDGEEVKQGTITRIDEFGYDYNLHVKYLDNGGKYEIVIYPQKQRIVKI